MLHPLNYHIGKDNRGLVKWLAFIAVVWAICATFTAIIFAGVICDHDPIWFDTVWQRILHPGYVR